MKLKLKGPRLRSRKPGREWNELKQRKKRMKRERPKKRKGLLLRPKELWMKSKLKQPRLRSWLLRQKHRESKLRDWQTSLRLRDWQLLQKHRESKPHVLRLRD